MKSHDFHPTILRSYDIRGIYENTLFDEDAYAIGNAFGQMTTPHKQPLIAVGRDGRLTSPRLAAALIEGLVAAGCAVIDIGIGPTPMLYFADRHFACDAAIQVTGSHNPPNHNGFKLVQSNVSFFGDQIQALGAVAAAGLITKKGGRVQIHDIQSTYVSRIIEDADFGDVNVVWDTGNGAAGPAITELLGKVSGSHSHLFAEIDGTFPNHHPNPVSNLSDHV